MSKKDDRIAELEAENAMLWDEVNRLSKPVQPIWISPQPQFDFSPRCSTCGTVITIGGWHHCWPSWQTVTSSGTGALDIYGGKLR